MTKLGRSDSNHLATGGDRRGTGWHSSTTRHPSTTQAKQFLTAALLAAMTLTGVIACSASPSATAIPPTKIASTMPSVPSAPQPAPAVQATVAPVITPHPPTATAVPSVSPARDLQQLGGDQKPIPAGGWVVNPVVLSFQAPASSVDSLVPQVEVARGDQRFAGTPTTQAAAVTPSGGVVQATITLANLVPDQYRWQARFADPKSGTVGPWVGLSTGAIDFQVAGPPPAIQSLTLSGSSQTATGTALISATDQPVLHWTLTTPQPLALDHLVEAVDHQATGPSAPPTDGTTIPTTSTSIPIGNLADGQWYFHVWAVDKAGQVGPPATLAAQVLRTPPQVENVVYRSWATNPSYQTLPINFTVSRDAQATLFILPESTGDPLRSYDLGKQTANAPIQVKWDGKDAKGQVVPPGSYRFMIEAVDAAGNQSQALYTGLTITDKVIKVSLAKEQMTAYAGSQVFATTVVTTGGQALPTRPGQFEILQKFSPFVFHAQYPKGSPYWFPDVTSHYAMLYDQPDADFIHDAPWRTIYGPGTDGPGIPGQVRTGSHGCVETPQATMTRLFAWTPLGTPVIVTP